MTDQQHTILVVDDEPPLRRMLHGHLTAMGLRVITASDGVEAIRLISSAKPDLILCDFKMPDIDGLELLRQVKSTIPRLPVVMMTGYAEEENLDMCLTAGAEDILVKPFRRAVLVDVIERIQRKVKRLSSLYNKP